MSDFLNQYSGILSVIGLILTIPLSVLANLLTPKIKNWNALRSVKFLEKRINELKLDILLAERLSTDSSYAIARFTHVIGTEISAAMFFIGSQIAFVHATINTGKDISWLSTGGGYLFFVIYLLSQVSAQFDYWKMRDSIGYFPEWKEKRLKQIEVFEAKLLQQLTKEKAES